MSGYFSRTLYLIWDAINDLKSPIEQPTSVQQNKAISESLKTSKAPSGSSCCEKNECMPIDTKAAIRNKSPAKRPPLDALKNFFENL